MLNRPIPQEGGQIRILRASDWQMSFGERAALEGVLSQLKPRLAIEIGTAEGGSLERVAAHSEEVHSFDLVPPADTARALPNVVFHTGNSHELLPRLLGELAEQGSNVDFVLVDGDHSAEGVRRDLVDLLDSPAVGRTLIVMHDTLNEVVRAGLEQVDYPGYPKVAHVDLDFVAGYMFREPSLEHELWGGLGLVIVDSARPAYFSGSVWQQRYYEAFSLIREARDCVVARESGAAAAAERDRDALRQELEQTRGWLDAIQASGSWRLTAPLRRAKRSLGRAP
ncbi:MAG: class I SAM-dependent methyltransferase [Thermoleophilaceae bacterium]